MLFLKILTLQALWFLIVLHGRELGILCISVTSIFLLVLNYLIYEPSYSIRRYIFFAIFFTLYGLMTDQLQVKLGAIDEKSYDFTYIFLWSIFIMYYNDIFSKLKGLNIFILGLLGAVGGSLAYYSAYKLGSIELGEMGEAGLIGFNVINWAIFFPLSMKFVHSEKFWNKVLDYSIIYNFDLHGFKRHQKSFKDNYNYDRLGKTRVLLTGGTSGIGEGGVKTFSKLGCEIHFTGRDEGKAKSLIAQLGGNRFHELDLANLENINSFCKECPDFDVVVLNAGGMPEKKVMTDEGIELQCASQLLGHLLLVELLREHKKLKADARIIWMSSGGMYLKKLDLDNLFNPNDYDKVATYANVKRAQVTLVEELASSEKWRDVTHVSMHPGWVRTKGLEEALPGFYKFISSNLRSPEQGADTMVWLALTQDSIKDGAFYFDREVVSPYIHKSFKPSRTERDRLLKEVGEYLSSFKQKLNQ